MPPNGETTAPANEESVLSLLQGFLREQETRTAIVNELQTAFDEAGISDQALARVVEISGAGLLEIKAKIDAILESLQARGATNEKQLCLDVEHKEKERITEATRRQQIQRIIALNKENTNSVREMQAALTESDRK